MFSRSSVPTLAAGAAEEAGPVQRAVQWIHEHYFKFMGLGARISVLRSRAAAVQADAALQADPERMDAADELAGGLSSLSGHWEAFAPRMRWVVERIPGLGLGAWIVPVAVSAVALFVAGAAAVIMRQADTAERALEMLEAGTLTAEEARILGLDLSASPVFGFSLGAGTALAAGVGVWWLLRRRAS